jgi:predicted lactoylglutathione lyase
MIFINLPVTDLARSIAFYEAIGAEKNAAFSNEQASMMVLSDTIHVMLLSHSFYSTFTGKEIADAHRTSQVLLCVSEESRAGVDSLVERAASAGGRVDPGPKQEMGDVMYGRSFEDPDGHHWEVMWMDVAAMQASQPAEPVEA